MHPTVPPTLPPTVHPTVPPTVPPTVRPTVPPTLHPSEFSTFAPSSDCIERQEWTQQRSDSTCPDYDSHEYGVGMCDTYDNPDYTSRLEFGLANNLYSSCSHACVYDIDTYDSDTPIAFR